MVKRVVCCWLTVTMLAGGGAIAAEPFSPDFVHFGNMGGLLPTFTIEDLPFPDSAEAKLLSSACAQCHNMPGPGMHTAEEWDQVFWKMYWRMQVMRANFDSFIVPKYQEAHGLLGYLKAFSIKPFKDYRGRRIDRNNEGYRLFQSICQQCHTLPDPSQHTAEEWPPTIAKMERNIASMGRTRATDANMKKILAFLQEHAGTESSLRFRQDNTE